MKRGGVPVSMTELQSIKKANLRSVFEVIAENQPVSRSTAAEKTDLSLMTVGKIADTLLMHGAVKQSKESKKRAGRRAGFLKVNEEKYFILLDLSTRPALLSLYDLRLNQKEEHIFSFDEAQPSLIQSRFGDLLLERGPENCCGVGISLPSSSLQSGIRTSFESELKEAFPDIPVFSDSPVHSAALAFAKKADKHNNKNILCIITVENKTSGVYVVNGSVHCGKNGSFGAIGDMRDSNGTTLNERLSSAQTPEDYIQRFSTDAANILRLLSPDTLVLATDKFSPNLKESFAEDLVQKQSIEPSALPEILEFPFTHDRARDGLAYRLRGIWLDSLSANE